MKTLVTLFAVGAVLFIVLQFVRPIIPTKPAIAEVQAPPAIKHILEKDCYSCHSDQRRLAWFDEIVPAYWLVRHDILTAREHLNFSTLGSKPAAAQKATLYEAVNMIQLGAMPLPQFLALHPDARVTPEELATLKAYLAPWSAAPSQSGSPTTASSKSDTAGAGSIHEESAAFALLAAVQPEFDGFPFDPDFENWKPISTTDRGDNNTFRFVLGNDIAQNAARSGNVLPWPDGTRFAKIAWQQELGSDGLVYPGKFVQVELMMKDARRYQHNDGWGWGRWRGLDLKPYGADARFVNECTGCHLPVRGDDYVYTLPIAAATIGHEDVLNNNAAALPAALPYQPLAWNAITMYVDPRSRATATLYGNEIAMEAVRAQAVHAQVAAPAATAYLANTVLALVTWAQRDDPHWFGARIPNVPLSVEFVQVSAGPSNSYRRFAGANLDEDHPPANVTAERTNFILGLKPAKLP
jgi:Haem-binding domain/Cytochrome P460